ncbi:MAG: sodium:proton antiporter [Ignisphaera sp.]
MDISIINTYLLMVTLVAMIANFVLSLYGVFFKPHYIKKIIALSMLSDTANTITLYIGYRRWVDGVPPTIPVITNRSIEGIYDVVRRSVDPLPPALVLTAVVIGLATTLFLVYLGYILYTHYKTLDMREIKRLKG